MADGTCNYCTGHAVTTFELEPGVEVRLCEVHFNKMRYFLGVASQVVYSMPQPPPVFVPYHDDMPYRINRSDQR